MKKVRIGSVGLGRLGYEHAVNIATKIPQCELRAVCDVDAARVTKVADELDVPGAAPILPPCARTPILMPS
jgi:myo-inositol 2-dehydrogenase/D-chiro-inositol 1-dehydrogenase